MLRVAEQYATTDTGRQRRANEDALLARSPLFVVADGMGGARAGEVASQIAVEAFKRGLQDSAEPEAALATLARAANARIYEQGNIVVIEDLGSTNGTYLNEELLETPRPLHPGDRVRIGDSEFAFEVD